MDITTFFWLLVVAGGPIAIGLVLAWAMLKRRRLTASEKAARNVAVDNLYGKN
jgi:hypothetical protein